MTRAFFLFSILALAACDAAVDGDHRGQRLATIEGSLPRAASSREGTEPRVGIAWLKKDHMSMPVDGQFPDIDIGLMGFKFDLFAPPPQDVWNTMDDFQFAMGLVVLTTPELGFLNPDAWPGFDRTLVLMYLPETPAPGSTLHAYLSHPGSISAGYHVFDIHKKTDAEYEAFVQCMLIGANQYGGFEPYHDEVVRCGPDGMSEMRPSALDLDSVFQITDTQNLPDQERLNVRPWF